MNCEKGFEACVDPQRFNRARDIARELRNGAPAMELRELLEAVLGLRATRLQVSQKGLSFVRSLALKHRFGFVAANYGLLVKPTPGLGGWADGVGEAVDGDDPDSLVNVYLGHDTESALTAKHAEECLGDEAFGEVLGIPLCCRRFYSHVAADAHNCGSQFHWSSVSARPQEVMVPAGANFLGRYFGRSFVSHFPCSLACPATCLQTNSRLKILSAIDQHFAEHIGATHYWSYLVLRAETIVAFRLTLPSSNSSSFKLLDPILLSSQQKGPGRWCKIRVRHDCLTLQDVGGRVIDVKLSDTRFVRPRGEC